eukprot:COSAG01_NODE_32540_length_579_cov_1.258333_2_plen_78_part_01
MGWGGGGGYGQFSGCWDGAGGYVEAQFSIVSGQTLFITVGQGGQGYWGTQGGSPNGGKGSFGSGGIGAGGGGSSFVQV